MSADKQEIRMDHRALRQLCTKIQKGYGVAERDAEVVSDCLVEANLMGLDTHGVIRLKFYMDRVKAGGNNPTPRIRTVRENACTALLDADNALGPVGGKRAMDLAIDKASKTGVGVVVVSRCNHYGPAGYYARMAADRQMIGISLTNVLGSMPPTGGAQALIGNNPYAIGFPAKDEPPVVVDGATSLSSWGKLFLCAQTGEPLPAGCYVDKDGRPTLDPKAVMDGGALLPFAGHKGYGIAVAIELLTGMLASATLDHDIAHPYKELGTPGENSFFMLALRIDNFSDADDFCRRMDEWIRFIRGSRRAAGTDRIWLPGEKEIEVRSQRLRDGIPLNTKMAEELQTLSR
ncbi:MAG: Ldh family oxidoreductase [Kiritimatiellae bacterium]|nr:Ldh family oxidoreductase [Kiritimatiellia bacterium]